MTHRTYTDADDVAWEVWDVYPAAAARQLSTLGEAPPGPGVMDETPPVMSRFAVATELSAGWLCFSSKTGHRRLWPIPSAWELMSDVDLARLCAAAAEAPRGRKPGRAHA